MRLWPFTAAEKLTSQSGRKLVEEILSAPLADIIDTRALYKHRLSLLRHELRVFQKASRKKDAHYPRSRAVKGHESRWMAEVVKLGRAKLPIVKVEWEDSSQPISEWQWIDAYQIPEVVNCLSVGFLVAKTKRAVALAANLGDLQHERGQASGIIRIPRSAIRKLTYL